MLFALMRMCGMSPYFIVALLMYSQWHSHDQMSTLCVDTQQYYYKGDYSILRESLGLT